MTPKVLMKIEWNIISGRDKILLLLNSVIIELHHFIPVEASDDIVALLNRVGEAQRDVVAVPPLE